MSGNRIVDKTVLLQKEVWALLQYPDGSEFCFKTTLNNDILREKGIILKEGMLPRLDKKYYWDGRFVYRQFSFEGVTLSLWDDLTYTDAKSQQLHEFL